jgi:uncharacterized protein YlxP (DUF503 family)
VSLRLPENQSLKGKRRVTQSIVSRVRTRFNVSIAEVGDNDLWQRLTLGISCVSNDGRHANEMLSRVVQYIEETTGDAELLDYDVEMVSGI